MKLKNTSKFTNKEVRDLIRIAKGSTNIKNVVFHIKNSKKMFGGTCYGQGISWMSINGRTIYHPDPLIVARVQKDNDKYPYEMNKEYTGRGRKYNTRKPKYTVNNAHEMLLVILAHEIYHYKEWNTKNRGSEIKAERYAMKKLMKYREVVK